MTTATRPRTPELASRADAAYLEFVTSLRLFNSNAIRGAMKETYFEGAKAKEAQTGRTPQTLDEAREILDRAPIARWYKRIARTSQEMNWSRVISSMAGQASEIEQELQAAESQGPGKLILDPELQYPDYFNAAEFHIMPGSYHGRTLSGHIYYLGTRVFHLGRDTGKDPEERKHTFANQVKVPADGKVNRVLELGCSVGQSTMALKRRFPDAEVWGTDISAAMVRYAHWLALQRGMDVNFAQMAAENLKFPDNTFDIVYCYIVFHEVPVEDINRIIREAYRVLRPGGVFNVVDFASSKQWTPFDAYIRQYDAENNDEPYSVDFCHMDLLEAFRAAGFKDVAEQPLTPIDVLRTGVK